MAQSRIMRDATAEDYLAALLATQGDRMSAAEELCRAAVRLAQAQRELEDAERAYRYTRESAESTGWTAADLDRAGLPRVATWVGEDRATPPAPVPTAPAHALDAPLYEYPFEGTSRLSAYLPG